MTPSLIRQKAIHLLTHKRDLERERTNTGEREVGVTEEVEVILTGGGSQETEMTSPGTIKKIRGTKRKTRRKKTRSKKREVRNLLKEKKSERNKPDLQKLECLPK